ncbi:unnamed protein product, partial [Ectocarpus sp. 12 AP-2014]
KLLPQRRNPWACAHPGRGRVARRGRRFHPETRVLRICAARTKILWRKGYLSIHDTCDQGTPCQTSCRTKLYESKGMTPCDVLLDVH